MLFNVALEKAKIIFWDFDGVIKESVTVKTEAFKKMFSEYGNEIVKKVKIHHEANGGISRFEKIQYYFEKFIGVQLRNSELQGKYEEFSSMVVDEVISSEWVPGVEKYLKKNPYQQIFILVTATPQEEIEGILEAIGLDSVFEAVYGAPDRKFDIVQRVMLNTNYLAQHALFLGDSYIDWQAAYRNNIKFFLCKTPTNNKLQKENHLDAYKDFSSF